jgi:chromosomal replication initiator protein
VNKIIADVCVEYNVSRYDLTSSRRTKDISNARQDAAWRMRRDTSLSLPQIGRRLGNRDHGTIIHALRAHEARMAGGKYVKTRGKP